MAMLLYRVQSFTFSQIVQMFSLFMLRVVILSVVMLSVVILRSY